MTFKLGAYFQLGKYECDLTLLFQKLLTVASLLYVGAVKLRICLAPNFRAMAYTIQCNMFS